MRRDMSLDGGFFERWVRDAVRGDRCCEVVKLVVSRLHIAVEAVRMEYDGGLLWPLRRARWGEETKKRFGGRLRSKDSSEMVIYNEKKWFLSESSNIDINIDMKRGNWCMMRDA